MANDILDRPLEKQHTAADARVARQASLGTNVAILGTSHVLPEKIISNNAFTASGAVTNEWIMTRTGIAERRFGALRLDLRVRASIDQEPDDGRGAVGGGEHQRRFQ